MTDRIKSLTIVLEHDVRDDDIVSLITAITQFRGVLSVETCVTEIDSQVAEQSKKMNLREKLFKILGMGCTDGIDS